jgi:hypothetical protein
MSSELAFALGACPRAFVAIGLFFGMGDILMLTGALLMLPGGGCLLRCITAANDPAHSRITLEPIGVVNVLAPGDTPKRRLAQ